MSNLPPQLGDIPKQSEFSVPTLADTTGNGATSGGITTGGSFDSTHNTTRSSTRNSTSNTTSQETSAKIENAKTTVMNNVNSAMDTVANHPMTQSVRDTVTNGPVAQNVKDQSAKTSAEASKLAQTRKTPDTQAATGQPLTHYHSFFYSLLTWEHPRVTAISYASIVAAIFIARYVPILRLTFKMLAYALGTTALIEGAGQMVMGHSLVSAVRPRKYYTIPREALESSLQDIEQLLNFFVIETQRLLFAEDASKTFAAFLATFIGYWLIKFTPLWGLSLIAVSISYLAPLIYISNKELIDEQLAHASKIVNAQTAQLKDIAATHTANATESLKGYAGDYTAKAQEMIGSARRSVSPATQKASGPTAGSTEGKGYTDRDFPHAPKQEPTPGVTSHDEQAAASQFNAVPAS